METKVDFEKIAEVILKIAALIGVSAAVFTFAYNHYQCTQGTWYSIFSIPVFGLAMLVFSTALGLSDKVFGTFRDLDLWTGSTGNRAFNFLLYLIGYF